MAESILFSRVDNVLGKVASLAVEQFWLAWGLEADLNKLRTTLSGINAVVLDAEDQPTSNRRITLWLKQLKDVLYNVEDVLDHVAYEASRKQALATSTGSRVINRRKVRCFFSGSNPIAFRLRIGSKIKRIRLRLDEIAHQKSQFNLAERLDNSCARPREREMTHSFVDTSVIIGRDGEREALVKFLINSRPRGHDHGSVSVMPIVGIGGLGKTALAQMVFNDPRIVRHFDQKVWVCLGDVKIFGVNQVIAKICKAVTEELSFDNQNPDQWHTVIQNELRDKQFLLVLDDVWDVNRDKWLALKALLACGARGSKIVVTTRISSIASCVGTTQAHNLKGLSHDKCVSLFKKLAFAKDAAVEKNLMKIGEEIVKKCKGVPLAVRTLGSLLFSKSEADWLSVRDSGIRKLEGSENGILQILRFSYDHLPTHLKQCFVYCSIFPQDYEFTSLWLISFWMAHGLLQLSRNESPEHVGKQYIKELLSRGFFQDFEDLGYTWRFKMHDLVRDLACSLGQGEFEIINEDEKDISENVRHVYVEAEQQLSGIPNYNAIRTLIVGGKVSSEFVEACISKFKNIRVLWFLHSEFELLPNSVGTLKHLRCFKLFNCRRLKRLPDSICKLHNLEYVSLQGCKELEEVPEDIGELVNLRQLWITTQQKYLPKKNGIRCLTSLQILVIESCLNLEILFTGTHLQLTSLQKMVVRNCRSLKCLFPPQATAYLPALEDLNITLCRNLDLSLVDGDHFLNLPKLGSLRLVMLPKLERLPDWIQRCANTLQYLKISYCYYLAALPEWLPDLTSLQTLKLHHCRKLLSLPAGMESLTTLKELYIRCCKVLMKRCDKGSGEDWPKIAHVPNIRLLSYKPRYLPECFQYGMA